MLLCVSLRIFYTWIDIFCIIKDYSRYYEEYPSHFHSWNFEPPNKKCNSSHLSLKWYPFSRDIFLNLICIDYLGKYCTPAVPFIMESIGLQVCGELSSLTPCGLTSSCTFAVKFKLQVSKTGGFLNLVPVFCLLPFGKICWALHAQDAFKYLIFSCK